MTSTAVDPVVPIVPSHPQLEGRIATALAKTVVPSPRSSVPGAAINAPVPVHTERQARQQTNGTTSSEVHLTTPIERGILGHGDLHVVSHVRNDVALEESQQSQLPPSQMETPEIQSQTMRSTTVAVESQVQRAPIAEGTLPIKPRRTPTQRL